MSKALDNLKNRASKSAQATSVLSEITKSREEVSEPNLTGGYRPEQDMPRGSQALEAFQPHELTVSRVLDLMFESMEKFEKVYAHHNQELEPFLKMVEMSEQASQLDHDEALSHMCNRAIDIYNRIERIKDQIERLTIRIN